jgi:hypothetical protein
MEDSYARLNPNPLKIAAWRQHLILSSSDQHPKGHDATPDVLYNRAIPMLLDLKNDLLKLGWQEVPKAQLPPGLLFTLQSPGSNSRPSTSSSRRSQDPEPSFFDTKLGRLTMTPYTDPVVFPLPAELSAFLEYHEQFEQVLHNSQLFRLKAGDRGHLSLITSNEPHLLATSPLRDIFYLLQLLVPGMFLLVHDSLSFSQEKPFSLAITNKGARGGESPRETLNGNDSRDGNKVVLLRKRRALPPAEWIKERYEALEAIFGVYLLRERLSCAQDVELTIWETIHGSSGDRLETG